MLLIDLLLGIQTKPVPFWFMRQAGRYLPEYKKVRANFPNFLSFCYTPDAACEVTLQPIDRFDMDAAIIFSDILVIPDALGRKVQFQETIGPVLEKITRVEEIAALTISEIPVRLAPVYTAIRTTRAALAPHKALIGFCGSPWTLACYMLQGRSSRDFAEARQFALKQPDAFRQLMGILVDAVSQHAINQIEAGANAIQLFDSWSGVLSEVEFETYVIQPTRVIVERIRARYPSIPIIGFPRMCGTKLVSYAEITKVDAVSFDGSVNLEFARQLQTTCAVQGNLDSEILAGNKAMAISQTKKILEVFSGTKFIFNLAHGIVPHTPIEHVQAVSDMIKAQR